MTIPDSTRVAAAYLARKGRTKIAGEVIFKKDRGDDANSWAYQDNPPSLREIPRDFNYSPKHQKPLVKILRATLAALGHTLSGYNYFAKVKSARVSPDGNLGGRGYIQKIADMRKQYMNCVEALAALSDTIYDEVNAPHWSVLSRQEDEEERADVKTLIEDSEEIRKDPQEWADQEMTEEFGDEEAQRVDPDRADRRRVEDLEDGWDTWDEKREVETTVPNQMVEAPGGGRTARRKMARDIRLENGSSRIAYEWLAKKDLLPGGLADKKLPSQFPAEQLAQGTEVEVEHTDDRRKALEIAMDHLVEDPAYYTKLETIEGKHASENTGLFKSLNEVLVTLPQKLAGFDWASTSRGARLTWAGQQVGNLQRYGSEWVIVYQDSKGCGVTHHVASANDLEEWATALGRYFKEAKKTLKGEHN